MSGIFAKIGRVDFSELDNPSSNLEPTEYVLSETRKYFSNGLGVEADDTWKFFERVLKLSSSSGNDITLISADQILVSDDKTKYFILQGLDFENETTRRREVFERLVNSKGKEECENFLAGITDPYVLIFVDISKPLLLIAKDPMGRKSLLYQFNSEKRVALFSTVSPPKYEGNEEEEEGEECEDDFVKESDPTWKELDISKIYFFTRNESQSWSIQSTSWNEIFTRNNLFHPLSIHRTNELLYEENMTDEICQSFENELFRTLQSSVEKRISKNDQRVAIMFSGGIDSFALAYITCQIFDSKEYYSRDDSVIELFNVNFGDKISSDRKQAIIGFEKLIKRFSKLNIKLILINKSKEDLERSKETVKRLIYPRNTVLDYNIASAIYHSSCGVGIEYNDFIKKIDRIYRSNAKIFFSGLGADELFGGYGRHRTSFLRKRPENEENEEGDDNELSNFDIYHWKRLNKELGLDMNRLWLRNFARDDRLLSASKKSARYPFLDETVIKLVYTKIPLNCICDLNKEKGVGDKKILRNIVKRIMKFEEEGKMVKRAIQFGSNISKISFRKRKGSDRI